MRMQFAVGPDQAELLSLPWSVPLVDWSGDQLVSLPRGISRHVVRFARAGGTVYAIKEIDARLAEREYALLLQLQARALPVVRGIGVVAERVAADGTPLDAALITKHLRFSLPYRALFSRSMEPDVESKLIGALAELLVRLHLAGFAWGDCSLSNTLFRRDAGALSAYLVDAETGELHDSLSDGQRHYDLDLACTNIGGELLDLEAGGMLPSNVDPAEASQHIVEKYTALWSELMRTETLASDDWSLVEERLRRLNELGYDAAQIQVTAVEGTPRVQVRTQVVEAGHHRRRLEYLTGLVVQENQARRILNALDTYRARHTAFSAEVDEADVARQWLKDEFEPVLAVVPPRLMLKLEPAEIFHEVLEHRWFLSEKAGSEVPMEAAAKSYVDSVLPTRPDEAALIDSDLMGLWAAEAT